MKNQLLLTALAVVMIAASASSTFACACCADRGTYSVWTNAIRDYENELFKDIKFGKVAEFYMTEANSEDTHGLGALEKEWSTGVFENPDLVDAYPGNAWKLDFRSRGGLKGGLLLPRPIRMTTRRVDIPDNKSTSTEAVLYKEWILKGTVRSGSGFLRAGVASPTSFTLIFQGHGNNCDNADDFTNWRLEISGKRAIYAFFGKTEAGEKEAADLTPAS